MDCGDSFIMFTYFQTHHIVYINYVQIFVCESYLN